MAGVVCGGGRAWRGVRVRGACMPGEVGWWCECLREGMHGPAHVPPGGVWP